jgi:hypothetical protein
LLGILDETELQNTLIFKRAEEHCSGLLMDKKNIVTMEGQTGFVPFLHAGPLYATFGNPTRH